ncbi:hypothetical protein N9S59_01070 [Pseudomonadota bacterium]|nr:hypothetical protein [Pseudomonadota bacterium]
MSTVGNEDLMEDILIDIENNPQGNMRRYYLRKLVIRELTDWEIEIPKKLNSDFLSGIYMGEMNYLTNRLCFEPNDILEYKYKLLIERITCFDNHQDDETYLFTYS